MYNNESVSLSPCTHQPPSGMLPSGNQHGPEEAAASHPHLHIGHHQGASCFHHGLGKAATSPTPLRPVATIRYCRQHWLEELDSHALEKL